MRAPVRRGPAALRDPLIRNSVMMLATTMLMALFGAIFWVLVARLASRSAVGLASSLATTAEALAIFALLGLNVSLLNTMPNNRRRASDVLVSTVVVALLGALLAIGYVVVLPAVAPALAQVVHGLWVSVAFAVIVAATTLNQLTDGIFLGIDRVRDNLWVNGVLTSVVKLAVPFMLAGAGAFAIFGGLGVATASAAVASLVVIFRFLPDRPTLRPSHELVRSTRLAGAGYVSMVLYIVPQLVFPVIIIDVLGPAASAVYFVGFQIVTLLNHGVYTVTNSMYAEVSRDPQRTKAVVNKAGRTIGGVVLAGIVVLCLAAPVVLAVFGSQYATAGVMTLRVLALGSIGVGFNYWSAMRLRIASHVRAMIGVQLATTIVMIVLALALAHHGIEAVAAAWGIGQLAGGVAGYVVSRTIAPIGSVTTAAPKRAPRPVREDTVVGQTVVAVVAPRYLEVGGMQNYVRRVVSWLDEQESMSVVIVTTHAARGRRTLTIDGVPVIALGAWATVSNTQVNPLWFWQLRRLFRDHQVDLVHAHSPVPLFADAALFAAGKRHSVLTYHAGSLVKGTGGLIDVALRTYERWVLPRVFARADRLVSVSPMASTEQTGRAVLIPPGVDASLFRPAPLPVRAKSVVYVGRVESTSRWKGLSVLLDAFAWLIADVPDAVLEVVGDGDDVRELQAQAHRLGIADRVHWHGALPGERIVGVLQRAGVAVLPSLTAAESFGMVLIEAMACGRPVVGSDVGGIPFVVRDGVDGLLVKPGDARSLVTALRTVLLDPDLARALGRAGRRAVEHRWDWSRRRDQTLAVVHDLLAPSDTAPSDTAPSDTAVARAVPAPVMIAPAMSAPDEPLVALTTSVLSEAAR